MQKKPLSLQDVLDLQISIKRCNAVYTENSDQAICLFEQLGSNVLGRYSDDGHQAIAHIDHDGRFVLTICGTRASTGTSIQTFTDLFEDVDFSSIDLKEHPGRVAAGAHMGLDKLFTWALDLFNKNNPTGSVHVEGHSLGGQRVHLACLYIPNERIGSLTAWEPPKAADDAYYATFASAFEKCMTVLHGQDPWAAWPWIEETLKHPPGDLLWLHDGTYDWVTRESWIGGSMLHSSDHDTNQVIQAVNKLTEV